MADSPIRCLKSVPGFMCYASGEHPAPRTDTVENDRYFVLVLGEFYYENRATPPAEIVLSRLQHTDPREIWSGLEGMYAAVVYDKKAGKAHFATDRLGMRYLYLYKAENALMWATEPKAFAGYSGYTPRIDRAALDDFFRCDFITGNRSLLEGVALLPAGTVRTYDFEKDSETDVTYWSWREAQSGVMTGESPGEVSGEPSGVVSVGASRVLSSEPADDFNIREAAADLAELFTRSVRERLHVQGRDYSEIIGLPLSGGLDSRAILSAISHPEGMYSYTFGKKGSADVKIAQKLSKIAGTDHEFIEIDYGNWLKPRLKGVWWTDGQINIMHMHGIEALDAVSARINIQLNGGVQNFIRGALAEPDRAHFGSRAEYELTRVRRFQRLGTVIDDRRILTRLPFYDYAMIDYISQVPGDLLAHDRLYLRMLLAHFPELFRGIPDGNSGIPLNTRLPGSRRLLRRVLRKTGLAKDEIFDYPNGIRQQFHVFRYFLGRQETMLHEFGYKSQIDYLLDPSRNWSALECETLCRLLTLEAYLRFLDQPGKVDDIIEKAMSHSN